MSMIDIMIAVVVLLMLSIATVVSMQNAVRLNDAMKSQDVTLRAPMTRIRQELRLAFLATDLTAVERYRTVFVGTKGNPDTLWFSTRGHQRLYRDARESDQAEITIWAEPMPRIDGLDPEGLVLYHRESTPIDGKPGEGGVIHPIAYNVKSFQLRYLDHRTNEWRDEWDTRGADTPNVLPRAVEIAMVVLRPDPREPGRYVEKAVKSTIVLEFATPLVPKGPQEVLQ
jgi:general secretion pathway protein J